MRDAVSVGRRSPGAFWDQFDVLPGEPLRDQIIEAIHQHDRLVVVLSANSMASDWVRQEIELAWYHKRDSLVPIRLCEIDEIRAWTAKHERLADLAGLFPVLDFSAWRNKTKYAPAVSKLLRSLAGGLTYVAPPGGRDGGRAAESHGRRLHGMVHVCEERPARPHSG